MTSDKNFYQKFSNNLSRDVKLSNYSWFNLGGNAEYFYKVQNKMQLIEFLKEIKKKKLKTVTIGAGSNTLFRDNGVKGAVIKLGKNFSNISFDEDAYDYQVESVVSTIIDNKKQNLSLEDSKKNIKTILALIKSSKINKIVKL